MSLTIEDLKKAKANLEENIFELIIKFKQDYKVNVTDIKLDYYLSPSEEEPLIQFLNWIKISIDI